MTVAHTPGPWYVLGLDVWSEEGKIAVSPSGVIAQIEVNMHLIAAAPDLLEALLAFVREVDPDGVSEELFKRSYEAIAKARGEA